MKRNSPKSLEHGHGAEEESAASGGAASRAGGTPATPPGTGVVSGLTANVLVLNRSYMPIHVTSARRAFTLVFKGDAEAINFDQERMQSFDFAQWLAFSTREPAEEDDDWVATISWKIRVPRIVRLLTYGKLPVGRVNFSRKNVLMRDEFRCQYCGGRAHGKELTLDHVQPRSRGGKHCWTNVVACCYRCNDRKGRLTPREAGMHLLREPVAPKRSPELKKKLEERKYRVWRAFFN